MAEVKDKLVDLEDLKVLSDDTTTKIGGKLAVPLNEGTQGQVLTAKGDGTSEWADAQGGSLDIDEEGLLTKNGIPVHQIVFSENASPQGSGSEVAILASDDLMSTPIIGVSVAYSDKAEASLFSGRAYFSSQVSEPTSVLSLGVSPTGGRLIQKIIALRGRNVPRRTKSTELVVLDDVIDSSPIGYLEPSFDPFIPGLCKGDETTISMEVGTGALSVKDGGVTMSHLAQDVKDAISAGGGGTTVDEATIRRIVNEQLAKMKFTINDQGHLIIETPEA